MRTLRAKEEGMSIKPGDETLKCLYKYRELAGNGPDGLNSNTVKLLEDGQIYFSKPNAFLMIRLTQRLTTIPQPRKTKFGDISLDRVYPFR